MKELIYWAGIAIAIVSAMAINYLPNPSEILFVPAFGGLIAAGLSLLCGYDL